MAHIRRLAGAAGLVSLAAIGCGLSLKQKNIGSWQISLDDSGRTQNEQAPRLRDAGAAPVDHSERTRREQAGSRPTGSRSLAGQPRPEEEAKEAERALAAAEPIPTDALVRAIEESAESPNAMFVQLRRYRVEMRRGRGTIGVYRIDAEPWPRQISDDEVGQTWAGFQAYLRAARACGARVDAERSPALNVVPGCLRLISVEKAGAPTWIADVLTGVRARDVATASAAFNQRREVERDLLVSALRKMDREGSDEERSSILGAVLAAVWMPQTADERATWWGKEIFHEHAGVVGSVLVVIGAETAARLRAAERDPKRFLDLYANANQHPIVLALKAIDPPLIQPYVDALEPFTEIKARVEERLRDQLAAAERAEARARHAEVVRSLKRTPEQARTIMTVLAVIRQLCASVARANVLQAEYERRCPDQECPNGVIQRFASQFDAVKWQHERILAKLQKPNAEASGYGDEYFETYQSYMQEEIECQCPNPGVEKPGWCDRK